MGKERKDQKQVRQEAAAHLADVVRQERCRSSGLISKNKS